MHRLADMVLNFDWHIFLDIIVSFFYTIVQILNRVPISRYLIFNDCHLILIFLHINFASLQLSSKLLKILNFVCMLLNVLLILFQSIRVRH